MSLVRRTFLLTAGATLAAARVAHAQDESPRGPYSLLDRPAPDFSVPLHGGGSRNLEDFRGRVLILAFGGLWCPPCISDGANINELAGLAVQSEIEFLYLHCGPEFGLWTQHGNRRPRVADAESAWNLYFIENHYNFPVAFDLSRRRDIARDYNIRWFPSFIVIDRIGRIRAWRTALGRNGARAFISVAREAAGETI